MAQSKTIAKTLFIITFMAVVASVATANVFKVAAPKKLLSGDDMIPITTDDLLPTSAAKSLTTSRAGVVAIQRQLSEGDGMITITTDDLLPSSAAKVIAKDAARGVPTQIQLTGGKVPTL
jgi:hypothetical protein